jgi:hypothetical protein
MIHSKYRGRSRRGSVGRALVNLLVVGVGSAVVGAVVIGPKIAGQLPYAPFAPAREQRASAELPVSDHSGEAAGSENEEGAPRERRHRRHRTESSDETSRSDRPAQSEQSDSPAPGGARLEDAGASVTIIPRDDEPPAAATSDTGASMAGPRDREPSQPRSRARRTEDARAEPARDAAPHDTAPRERRRTRRERPEPDSAVRESVPSGRRTRDAEPISRPILSPERDPQLLPGDEAPRTLFRVRVGRYESQEAAQRLLDEMSAAVGLGGSVVRIGSHYRVQVGAYASRANADKIADTLRSRSYTPDVSASSPR